MAVGAVVRVDHAGLGPVADGRTAEEVGGHRDVEHVVPATAGEALDARGDAAHRVVAHRDPGGVGLAVALPGGELAAAEEAALRVAGDGVVPGLHHQGDDDLLRPPPHAEVAQQHHRVASHLAEPGERSRPGAAVGECGGEQAHRVAAPAVAHGLDVGVLVRVERRGDGDAAREVDVLAEGPSAEDGLGVRAGELAEPLGEVRQVALVAHPVQEPLGAHRPRGDHDLVGREGAAALADPCARALGVHGPAPAGERPHARDRGERVHLRAGLLGQVEVVLQEGVLRSVAAAGHALAALDAPAAVGARSAEERVGHPLAGAVAEEHAHRCRAERVAHAHLLGHGPHDLVGGSDGRVRDHAEHALRLVVERGQLVAPVGDAGPLRVGVERRQRLVERVGVVERAAADSGAGQHHHVLDERDPLDAVAPELRRPEEGAEAPGGGRERRLVEPLARLEHRDPVALLGEPQRGGAAAEPAADDHHVDVVIRHGGTVDPAADRGRLSYEVAGVAAVR